MWEQTALGATDRTASSYVPAGAPGHFADPMPTAGVTVLTGPGAGMVVPIGPHGLLIGRDFESDLVVPERTVSLCHARIASDDDGAYYVEDLASTHGTFVGRRRVSRAVLAPDDSVRLGDVLHLRFWIDDAQEAIQQRSRYEATVRDPVTGAYNRAYFVERLAGEVTRAMAGGVGAALLLVDIDALGDIYQQHGLFGGDQALRGVADRIGAVMDAEDVVARFEGETLAVLAPGADRESAAKLARRIRGGVALHRIAVRSARISLTVCIGVVALDELGVTCCPVVDLMAIAQARIAAARRGGRNRVRAAG
jgi:diguanylate cyclase (GGDEF)-like protein